MKEYTFELYQDGMKVAAVSSPLLREAKREIERYADQYRQGGEVQIRFSERTIRNRK